MDGGQHGVVRKVADRPVALLLEVGPPGAGQTVKSVDGVGRRCGPAAREEGAFVGRAAVVADRHVGERTAQHPLLLPDVPGDVGEGFFNFGGEVLAREQVGEVGVAAVAVEVHELGAADGQAGAAQDVRLDGEVGEVLLLDPGGRLDLDEVPAAAAALEDVGEDQDAVVLEGRFVEDLGAVAERCGGFVEAALALGVEG